MATPKPKGALSDAAILAKMKVEAPWLYATYTNPAFTKAQQQVFMGWARAAAAGKPVTSQQQAAETYSWPITQIWNTNQQTMFQKSLNNPGEYKSELAAAQTDVDQLIKTKGLTVNPETRDKAVNQVLLQGMSISDPRVIQLLTDTYQYPTATETNASPTPASGASSVAVTDINKIFSDYGIPVPKDPAQMTEFVKGIIGPNGDTQAVTDYAKQQAELLYPWMKGSLDAGGTVANYLNPYTTSISNTLGINPSQIDWTDPKWQSVVAKKDPTGVSIPQTLDQSLYTIKSDPRFKYAQSTNGINEAYDNVNALAKMFGQVG